MRLPVVFRTAHVQPVGAADHLVEAPEAQPRHDPPHFLGDEEEEIDDMLRRAGEAPPELLVLRGDADRAGVQVAFAHHDAAHRNQRRGREAEFVRAEQRADGDIAPGAQAAIHLHGDAGAQVVEHQRLVRLGQRPISQGEPAWVSEVSGRGAGAAFETRDRDMVGARLGDAGGDRADADLRDQLDADARRRVHVLQVVDQLGQILDRIDVVVRRRRDQADARRRVADLAQCCGPPCGREAGRPRRAWRPAPS